MEASPVTTVTSLLRLLGLLSLLLCLGACGGGGGGGGGDNAPLAESPPLIQSFGASPSSLLPTQASTLSWNAANVTQVSITPNVGTQPAQGSVTVRPLVTTTYTLTATNSAGSRSATATVTITAAPAAPDVVSFAANPTAIPAGGSAQLQWDTSNATLVSIDQGIGPRAVDGSVQVSPTATTTYRLTATGLGGSTTAEVTVTVIPAPVIGSFGASPASVEQGQSATLSWTTSGATTVSIDQGIGNRPVNGSTPVSPSATTTYRLTATGAGGIVTADTTVVVTAPPPPIVDSFGVAPATVVKGESATLNWATTHATQVSIDHGIGNRAPDGSISVSPNATTTYRLTATGAGGEQTAEITLRVVTYDWTALAAALDSYLGTDEGQVEGYIFALEISGRTVFERAGGNLLTGLAIPIASASKPPSAAAILSLADSGLLDLDAPVSTYIGNSIDWPLDKATITMRMLLNHSSGLVFGSPCLEDDTTTLQACAQEIADTPLNFPPGAVFNYSGAGYQLAGYVAQQAAGIPWVQLFQQRIGDPLQLASFRYVGNDNPRIGGGALSDTGDYLKIMRMFLDGGRANGQQVLSAESAASVSSDQIGLRPVLFKPVADDSELNEYSNGWWISEQSAHPGSNGPELSAPGLFGATPWMDFDKDYSATLWILKTTDTGTTIRSSIRPLILDQLNQ